MPTTHKEITENLEPNAKLLNYNYKLKLTTGMTSRMMKLPTTVSIESKASMTLDLPYKMIEDRARFNHLFASPFDDTTLFYYDKDASIQIIDCITSAVTEIIKIPRTTLSIELREYPSILFPNANCMIISDGCSNLYCYEKSDINEWKLTNSFQSSGPICVIDSTIDSEKLHILAYKSEINTSPEDLRKSLFTTSLIEFDLTDLKVKTVMQTTSTTGPLFSRIQKNANSFIIASEFPNDLIKKDIPTDSIIEPEVDSDVPMFQYNWTQTEEDVTIYVNLNTTVDKRFVNGRFTNKYVHLSILHPLTIPIFNSESPLFDDINPTESIWTLEGTGELLTLYLSKKNAPFRWTQLFLNDDSIQETFDVGVLEAYNQSLEKFTDCPKVDPDQHMHALTEKAEAIDFEGQSISFTRCAKDESGIRITHRNFASGHEWLCSGFRGERDEVCMGYDVDGLVYTITDALKFEHTGTFSAFNFIKNSKLEKQFICYSKSGRYAVIVEMKRYVFVYMREEAGKEKSEQMMLDLYDLEPHAVEFDSVIGVQQCNGETIALLRNASIVFIDLNLN